MPNKSLFQEVKRFINIRAVGSTYNSSELCNYTRGTEYVTWWKRNISNESYRTRTYQTYLKRLGFLKNVRRGVWQIVAHIPEWLDSGHVNSALGYMYTWDGAAQRHIRPLYKGETHGQIIERINAAIAKHQPALVNHKPEAETLSNGLATFQVIDPILACIQLRAMGVLAVPCDEGEIELHIIDKRAAENLAHWMVNNGYELNEYPMLENLLRAHWPEPEVEEEVERATTNLVVLNYVTQHVEITQGVYEDDVEQFLEDNYGDTSAYEYMTMKTLNLNVTQAH